MSQFTLKSWYHKWFKFIRFQQTRKRKKHWGGQTEIAKCVTLVNCQDVKSKGVIHSCNARFELKSEGLDIKEEGISIEITNKHFYPEHIFCLLCYSCMNFVWRPLAISQ